MSEDRSEMQESRFRFGHSASGDLPAPTPAPYADLKTAAPATDFPRLIEHAFPLKQTSLDSVHEKNVRHGHISTLHIWPARRPLAASRAALIATLLPDPGTPEKRLELCEKIGGRVVERLERKRMPSGQTIERVKEETLGGILRWGRETSNADTVEWFRKEIRKAYGGRSPRVLDPFAGGGSLPLEATRLGCEVTAVDTNPIAWLILKCTLEHPANLAGQTRPLPMFILDDEEFLEAFYEANPAVVGEGKATKKQSETLFASADVLQAGGAIIDRAVGGQQRRARAAGKAKQSRRCQGG